VVLITTDHTEKKLMNISVKISTSVVKFVTLNPPRKP